MATKAQLEQKVSDLQAVLVAVQDEREALKATINEQRGKLAETYRNLEVAEEAKDELAAAEVRIQELEDEVAEAQADDRDGEKAAKSEVELSNNSINAYLGKG